MKASSNKVSWATRRIFGQNSYELHANSVQLALTAAGAHMAPVTFFPDSESPIRPYAIAPWAEEALPPGTPQILASLRGDFFCSAFGANAEPYRGVHLPLHGETANAEWQPIARRNENAGSWIKLGMDLPLQGGRCEATTALLHDHSVIYQRHDLTALSGPINPGHHATITFPTTPASGRLSFSRYVQARTYFEPVERPETGGRSYFKADADIADLRAVPCIEGTTDITAYPARQGFEDVAILCADPTLPLAWSAVTFQSQGYLWFTLRDPEQLTCTLLWYSNGGRDYPPWNGRHVNVMGIEDMTGYFQTGLTASSRPNALSNLGVRTCLEPTRGQRLVIPYIQGVTRVPAGFDRVTQIQPHSNGRGLRMLADSGVAVEVPCQVDFLWSGQLPGLDLS